MSSHFVESLRQGWNDEGSGASRPCCTHRTCPTRLALISISATTRDSKEREWAQVDIPTCAQSGGKKEIPSSTCPISQQQQQSALLRKQKVDSRQAALSLSLSRCLFLSLFLFSLSREPVANVILMLFCLPFCAYVPCLRLLFCLQARLLKGKGTTHGVLQGIYGHGEYIPWCPGARKNKDLLDFGPG